MSGKISFYYKLNYNWLHKTKKIAMKKYTT